MMYPIQVGAGDIVFLMKGGGITSAVVKSVSKERAYLLPLHEQGQEVVKVADLITRHKYRREEPALMPVKKKASKKAAVKKENAKAKAKKKATEDEDDDDEDEDEEEEEEEAPKKKAGKSKAKASDDDDDDDDDDEEEEEEEDEDDDDDDDDEDEDEDEEEEKPKKKVKGKAKKSKSDDDDDDDDEDEDEDDDEDEPKKKKGKKGKKKGSGKRGPKEVDPSKPMGRPGTKRRAIFDAMKKGGTPAEIIDMAIEIDGEDGKVSKDDKQKYKNMGNAAIKGFAKSLGERGYNVDINEKSGKIKVSLKK